MTRAGLTLDKREVLPPSGQTVHYKRPRQRTGPPRKMRIPTYRKQKYLCNFLKVHKRITHAVHITTA